MKELEKIFNQLIEIKSEEERNNFYNEMIKDMGHSALWRVFRQNMSMRRWAEDEYSKTKYPNNKLFIEEIVWEKEFEDFYKSLKEFNIDKIIFASGWSNSLSLVNFLIDKGAKVTGNEVYKIESNYSETKKEYYKGLVIEL